MAKLGFHQWESDPLFSAAEVVQDSADRMESIFRLLLHEQSLVQKDHPDKRLLTLIEHHRRDLATSLETAKWQLEDFEREVAIAARVDKSQRKQIAISRHKQFIGAIREQILHVNKSLVDTSVGSSVRNEWVNLNDQDRDGLAMFLSGGKSFEHPAHHDIEDRSMMTRFLDPASSSGFSNEIVEKKPRETVHLDMNGFEQSDNMLRNVASHYSLQMGSQVPSTILAAPSSRHDENESCDLEANEIEENSSYCKNKSGVFYNKINFVGSFRNLLSAYGGRGYRNFTNKWKDEEEHGHPSYDIVHATQRQSVRMRFDFQRLWLEFFARVMYLFWWIRDWLRRYQRTRIA